MSAPTTAQLQALKSAFVDNRPPYCAGTLPLPLESFTLFFGKGKLARRLNFVGASEEDLTHLVDVCDAATFGRNQQDILDESYRKALKLDSAHFATKVDFVRSGLLDIIRDDLLEGKEEQRPISAELYKLNVYGKDSFFKAHQDTPRGSTMFGSLVIVFPTAHEGGALVLRHNKNEWTIDSTKAPSEQASSPSIGYVAFFSDVEHEVLPVTVGYRVTITYNLYFGSDAASPPAQRLGASAYESTIKAALTDLLRDETFLPKGGYLGFGLRHSYPLALEDKTDTVAALTKCLKGNDATVMNACKALGLGASLQLLYEEDGALVLVSTYVNFEGDYVENAMWYELWESSGGKLIKLPKYDYKNFEVDFKVTWVTERMAFNKFKTHYITYGNEATSAYIYAQFCLIVEVGPYGNRSSPAEEGKNKQQ